MSPHSSYFAAQAVATTLESHFKQLIDQAIKNEEQNVATSPPANILEEVIDIAFWTSLGQEEGVSPKISLALLPPGQATEPILFGHRIPFTPPALTKLAPGVERPGIHLGAWHEADELYVWGLTYEVPSLCFVVDVSTPGLLVIKHRRLQGIGKFANVAVLQGNRVKVVDRNSPSLRECPDMLTSLLGFNSVQQSRSLNLLVQLATSMRAHGRGGALLVVPANSETWRESIVYPMKYTLEPAFSGLTQLMQEEVNSKNLIYWQGSINREVNIISGLTAIDGATVISDQYELLAFGAKIRRRQGREVVSQMLISEPVVGDKPAVVHPSTYGGTRHLSAAQFAHDQRDAMALVASQDGRFTVFVWSTCEQKVHAHRLDSLLL